MPQAVIITRPFYDFATSYLHRWGLDVYKHAKSTVPHVSDLEHKKATRKNLESYITKLKPEVVIIFGHGGTDCVLGQDNEELIKVGVNEYILKDCAIYALTCDSGSKLGPASMKAGAKGYIGYSQPFVFATAPHFSTNAQNDPIASLFLSPTIDIAKSLISGNSVKSAHDKGISSFIKNLEKVLLSKSKEEYLARFLAWDIKHQVYFD